MKKIYSKLSIIILTCLVIAALCSCDLSITKKDKFIVEERRGDKCLVNIDLEQTGTDIVVPEKVGDDVIYNIDLLGYYFSKIESIDVGNVKSLKSFRLELIDGSQSKLTRLDFSKNEKLTQVGVVDTQALNEIIFNENCESIHMHNTAIKEIDLKELKKLDHFSYNNGPLEELDVSNNPNLQWLRVINTNVKVIDVSNNPNLKGISAINTNINDIDLSNNPNLQFLRVENTQVKDIDISNNPNLQRLEVVNNSVNAIDVSNNPKLKEISAINTNVNAIDVSNNPKLELIRVNEGVQIIGSTNAQIDYVDEERAKRIKEED